MYRLTHDGKEEPFDTRTQAIRGMARAVRDQALTDGERRAFELWYVRRNYRSVAALLRKGHRYELSVSVSGERRIFAIDPPPPLPFEHPAQVPVTRDRTE